MKYNVAGRIDFSGLHHYFEEAVDEEEAEAFFSCILPDIVRSCLALPDLVTQPIPLLKKRDNRAITLSQKQVVLVPMVLLPHTQLLMDAFRYSVIYTDMIYYWVAIQWN